ncbi:MAG TPA: hypothetical protein VFQ11_09710 [Nocardioidaceae bacterium]|nr:hypothetical protein [Nocardioidaceae bacterium]
MTVTGDVRPGLRRERLTGLMSRCVTQMRIDLAGAVVVTEAATGPYAVTPVLAAMAGAEFVVGVTRDTRYGTADQVRQETYELARAAGVLDRLLVTTQSPHSVVPQGDVITNSGHLRPLDRTLVGLMKPDAVVPLMFESWEIQAGRVDLDLDAMRERGIRAAGTNERHPLVGVFCHLGTMAVKLLLDAGTGVRGDRVLLLCDNPFAAYIEGGLTSCGAEVRTQDTLRVTDLGDWQPDVVLVALTPTGKPVFDTVTTSLLRSTWPAAFVAQFWGDIDREALDRQGVAYWPPESPGAGHMAVLPSDVGPEPVVRLQAGGLKVASVLRTPHERRTAFDLGFLDEL